MDSRIESRLKQKLQSGQRKERLRFVPGVLFIDEVHMLDIECFSFLNRALENDMAPILVLATSRGIASIRGTNYRSPHGIRPDLLDHLLIITTQPYTEDEIRKVLDIRCDEEDAEMSADAKVLLTKIGMETSLRYAIHLITSSRCVRLTEEQGQVGGHRGYQRGLPALSGREEIDPVPDGVSEPVHVQCSIL
ncbi:uncharacterized protein LOC133901404 [Phragmites australis]|uniref:uncharacterized protein LOC133901404 n=1 Tax=Phragmites australis TaxID=29695 RepID=UPI002D790184|nr:uncharacterized protein LOC133901404 [Phragmites australis]